MGERHEVKTRCAPQHGVCGRPVGESAWWADCVTCGWTSERYPTSDDHASDLARSAGIAHRIAPRGAADADAVLAQWVRAR